MTKHSPAKKKKPSRSSSKDMAHPLYLYPAEKKLFDALPEGVREGWEVKEEKAVFTDTDVRRQMRLSVMKLHDPALKSLGKKMSELKDEKSMRAFLDGFDFKNVPEEDMTQLFFAMGPDAITFMMVSLCSGDMTDDDMDLVVYLSGIRHIVLEAFVSAYPSVK